MKITLRLLRPAAKRGSQEFELNCSIQDDRETYHHIQTL